MKTMYCRYPYRWDYRLSISARYIRSFRIILRAGERSTGADNDCIIKNGKTDYEENVVRTVREMSRTYADDLLGDLRERGR